MVDYIRARNDEHKEERMSQIKEATAELFASAPYAEITLTTIAEKLGWSRANLYKYVTTKEEIILEIADDKMEAYYTSRLAIFKKKYYDLANAISDRLSAILNIPQEAAYKIQLDVLFYASSNAVCCYKNPLVQKALTKINITPPAMDFYKDMKNFLKMRLEWK